MNWQNRFNNLFSTLESYQEYPLSRATTFRVGGACRLYAIPENGTRLIELLTFCREQGVNTFILGGGANTLFADSGFNGIVIDMKKIDYIKQEGNQVRAGAGVPLSQLAWWCGERSLAGLENFYAMPGTVGGSLWINARCYDQAISEVVTEVESLTCDLRIKRQPLNAVDYGYKSSPWQQNGEIILSATFCLRRQPARQLKKHCAAIFADRVSKGHFIAPSAGSVFKNSRSFGRSSGEIIDSLGLRGNSNGDAMISPLHGNIIINRRRASAQQILQLIAAIEQQVFDSYGFRLEREVVCVD